MSNAKFVGILVLNDDIIQSRTEMFQILQQIFTTLTHFISAKVNRWVEESPISELYEEDIDRADRAMV